ncbi:MAG: 16S rRNA (adenine(1518)-N(6)/adenine(1519)-N(6))-dimethyltransferase RsmA [Oscillospiraceae bacterium]|nr:16S rRNA (adenine(1518)-N(6)/adenine(1519)-N(6))-dimethyltransferase RsmA [Oscillospiraceae bacterium]
MNNLTDPSEIRRLLDAHGFRFSKSMGQNFLIDASVPRRIADSVQADRDCAVLEIGPGIGCLTAELSDRAGQVLSVELDRSLQPLLKETLSGRDNTEILFADVMKLDLDALIREKLTLPTKLVCANLPYNITTPLLTALIRTKAFDRICVMIQKEVAERICAAPGKKDYGAFSLLVRWYCEPELLFTVPPHCFMPQPKVTSAVIRLQRRPAPPAEVRDEELMFRIIRAAFNQRRKTLVNALSAAVPGLTKPDCERILKLCDLDTNIRGEKLNLVEFARISNEIGNFGNVDL